LGSFSQRRSIFPAGKNLAWRICSLAKTLFYPGALAARKSGHAAQKPPKPPAKNYLLKLF
jgi:hypothetical protein